MLKKHLKKIVSLVLVTMMAIGMSITAIAAEPYQNELEAVMDTSPADSGQVTHYDTTTGEMLVEDGELLTFDEVAIPVPKGSADTPSERGIEIYAQLTVKTALYVRPTLSGALSLKKSCCETCGKPFSM